MRSIILAVAALNSIGSAFAACSTNDIILKQADWLQGRIGSGVTHTIVGEIVNNCAEAVDAELQFTFRDKDSKVVGVLEHSPTNGRLLPSKASWPFQTLANPRGLPTSMSVAVIGAKTQR